MIQTASILWAVLATGGGIWAGIGWMSAHRCIESARTSRRTADRLAAERMRVITFWRDRTQKAEFALRTIDNQRSETTRKGNITRAAKRKALVAETAAKLLKRAA